MISQITIDQVRELPIVDVVRCYIDLQKSGSNYTALSPFNDEKTPSFFVVPAKNIFKCFSSGNGGDAVRFVMTKATLSFPEAIRDICQKFSIPVEYDQARHPKEYYDELELLYKINDNSAKHYVKRLLQLDADHPAYKELSINRRFTKDTITQWQLGYAPGDIGQSDPKNWQFLTHLMTNSGNHKQGVELGLIKSKDGLSYDAFRHRIIFPIVDYQGRCVGFGGRSLQPGKGNPKYINSSESKIFKKSKILYGLNFAEQAIRKHGHANIVEGYTDVISLHQASFENTVGTCGTAISEDHCKLLKRYTNRARLFYDSDEPGQRATLRAIDMLMEVGIQTSVIPMPDMPGKKIDPDELVRMFSSEIN